MRSNVQNLFTLYSLLRRKIIPFSLSLSCSFPCICTLLQYLFPVLSVYVDDAQVWELCPSVESAFRLVSKQCRRLLTKSCPFCLPHLYVCTHALQDDHICLIRSSDTWVGAVSFVLSRPIFRRILLFPTLECVQNGSAKHAAHSSIAGRDYFGIMKLNMES